MAKTQSHICVEGREFRKLYNVAITNIKQSRFRDFDAVACSGYSGASMAWPLSLKFEKDVILVRKDLDGYSHYLVEGPRTPCKVLIVDDTVCTRETMHRIVNGILSLNPDNEIAAAYLFCDKRFLAQDTLQKIVDEERTKLEELRRK